MLLIPLLRIKPRTPNLGSIRRAKPITRVSSVLNPEPPIWESRLFPKKVLLAVFSKPYENKLMGIGHHAANTLTKLALTVLTHALA